MRTVTAAETAILTHPSQAYRVWIKVEMTRVSAHTWGSETWVDLTDLNGHDWVRGVEYGESIDTPAWTATIQLHSHLTDNPLFSLSPFLANSINNTGGVLIQPYRKVRISTAVVPDGTPKANATYNVVFIGRVISYSMSDGAISVQCLDRTSELQAMFIENELAYGAADPTVATAADVEEIIQNIIDDHYNNNGTISGTVSAPRANPLSTRTTDGAPYQLYSANGDSTTPFNTSTGFAIREYKQAKSPVWDAITALARLIGYQLRMRWHTGTGINDFVLVLEEPARAASTADVTLYPGLGQCEIKSVSLSNQEVRNYVRVGYAEYGTNYTSTESSDASSITKYGRRFLEVQESAASQIDTSTEANKLRDGLLSDTKEPTVRVELQTPYLWYLQLNDLIGVAADSFYFDTDQKLALLSRRNVIQQGGRAASSLVVEGLPKAAKNRHIAMQRQYWQRRGVTQLNSASGRGGRVSNFNFSARTTE